MLYLISNAVTFTPEGGRITLSLTQIRDLLEDQAKSKK